MSTRRARADAKGRYGRTDLDGKPGPLADADKERRARLRAPRSSRCSVCCHPSDDLDAGRCRDRIACAERQPYLFGSEVMP